MYADVSDFPPIPVTEVLTLIFESVIYFIQ